MCRARNTRHGTRLCVGRCQVPGIRCPAYERRRRCGADSRTWRRPSWCPCVPTGRQARSAGEGLESGKESPGRHARPVAGREPGLTAWPCACSLTDGVCGLTASLRPATPVDPPPAPSGSLGRPERRFLLYKSGTLTALGRTSEARRVQEEALSLYLRKTGIDPTLLRLEAAICLAGDRSPTEACWPTSTTLLQIDPAHRTPIVEERAREVIEILPPGVQSSRAARELREILELPPGQM